MKSKFCKKRDPSVFSPKSLENDSFSRLFDENTEESE
jgi:hypothetical protein